ncbi:predicted protein [Plenodomus lingam JN3]|uniref:Predicted protein n=1 Tax=Leptosphaeria maculans (strain JN3 / isolate v23.1.3 / race Av1-4-5-6-7-8) TaxID=985895 RepID=E5AFK1_LEPMJ|nr:predicted protein [Plenodomus lingam JN3]CBY01990.1 predicted protein [Plenodomus lingam JN3]
MEASISNTAEHSQYLCCGHHSLRYLRSLHPSSHRSQLIYCLRIRAVSISALRRTSQLSLPSATWGSGVLVRSDSFPVRTVSFPNNQNIMLKAHNTLLITELTGDTRFGAIILS